MRGNPTRLYTVIGLSRFVPCASRQNRGRGAGSGLVVCGPRQLPPAGVRCRVTPMLIFATSNETEFLNMIKSIKLELKDGVVLELSLEDAKNLRKELNQIFGEPVTERHHHHHDYWPEPWRPYRPYYYIDWQPVTTTTITCSASSISPQADGISISAVGGTFDDGLSFANTEGSYTWIEPPETS